MSFGRVRIQAGAQAADFAGGGEVPGRCDSRSDPPGASGYCFDAGSFKGDSLLYGRVHLSGTC